MANITESVGTGATNRSHDVAMVQFMLKVLKTSRSSSYFGPAYTSRYSDDTARALTAFQSDHGLAGTGGAGGQTPGVVKPGSATWQALVAAFGAADAQFRAARTTEGFDLVYVAMAESKLGESVNAIHAAKNLQPDFRQKVVQLVQTFFKKSGLAWSLVPQTGGWRSFAGQEDLVTDAGFGESIHQYGYAVDLTVANVTWFAPDLRTHKSPFNLSGMTPQLVAQFYAARDKVADSLKLFRTTKAGDMGHLQNYDDNTLDSVSSLMALMHAVGPKKMKWKPEYRTPTNYWCDLGLGGDLYFVGTAANIWKQDSSRRISAADLAKALGAKQKADPKFSAGSFLGRSAPPVPAQPSEKDIQPSDIKAVQKMLRAEFDAAAASWKLWKPVEYTSAERRPLNPVKR